MADDRLEQAIRLVQSGKIEAARELLELILKKDQSNVPAWHWYAQTWPGAKEKARIWRACLRFNPGCEQVQQALRDLNVEPQKSIPSQVKPAAAAIPSEIPRKKTGSLLWLVWMSLGILAVVGAFAWLLSYDPGPKDPEPYKHVQPVEYYLYVPKAYAADKEWPLFIGIHGAGGNGLHCWHLWQAYADKEGFILLCPSIPGEPFGFRLDVGENTVWSAIGEVQRQYRTKPRMFFTGFSAGAYFIQAFTCDYPRAVSGLSILSSGNYVDPRAFPEVIPMLVMIGDRDNVIAVQGSRQFVDSLNGYGFNVQYEVMPRVGHAITKEGVKLTIDLFRKTIGK